MFLTFITSPRGTDPTFSPRPSRNIRKMWRKPKKSAGPSGSSEEPRPWKIKRFHPRAFLDESLFPLRLSPACLNLTACRLSKIHLVKMSVWRRLQYFCFQNGESANDDPGFSSHESPFLRRQGLG